MLVATGMPLFARLPRSLCVGPDGCIPVCHVHCPLVCLPPNSAGALSQLREGGLIIHSSFTQLTKLSRPCSTSMHTILVQLSLCAEGPSACDALLGRLTLYLSSTACCAHKPLNLFVPTCLSHPHLSMCHPPLSMDSQPPSMCLSFPQHLLFVPTQGCASPDLASHPIPLEDAVGDAPAAPKAPLQQLQHQPGARSTRIVYRAALSADQVRLWHANPCTLAGL